MSGVSRQPNEQLSYMYKLNKNYKESGNNVSLNGVQICKDRWSSFKKSQKDKLKTYLKSHSNPTGIVDEYINDPLKTIQSDPDKAITFDHKKKFYSRDVLCTMTRKELEEIAKEYLVDPKGKINNFLIQTIIKEQDTYRKSITKTDDIFEDTNKVVDPNIKEE